jgi:hypothetical protein
MIDLCLLPSEENILSSETSHLGITNNRKEMPDTSLKCID